MVTTTEMQDLGMTATFAFLQTRPAAVSVTQPGRYARSCTSNVYGDESAASKCTRKLSGKMLPFSGGRDVLRA